MKRIIDLTHTLTKSSPVYPNDLPWVLSDHKTHDKDGYHLSAISGNLHVGTHLDAPSHILDSKVMADDFPLDKGIGRAVVFDVRNQQSITLTSTQLDMIQPNDIVLLHTGWDHYYHQDTYYDHPNVSIKTARELIDKKISLLGMDMPSPDHPPFEVHKLMFEHDIWLIENLTNLNMLPSAIIDLWVIPIKIQAEAAYARVFALVNDV